MTRSPRKRAKGIPIQSFKENLLCCEDILSLVGFEVMMSLKLSNELPIKIER
jgi:hypothetical protein